MIGNKSGAHFIIEKKHSNVIMCLSKQNEVELYTT